METRRNRWQGERFVSSVTPISQTATAQRWGRRRFLTAAERLAVLGGATLLAACQQGQQTVVVTPAPAAGGQAGPTAARTPAAAATTAPAGAGSTTGATGAAASGMPAKPMYQMDPQHTGRSPFTGPRQALLARTFNTVAPEFRPSDAASASTEIQSSPVIGADGMIYLPNFAGYLFALRDGSTQGSLDLAWSFRVPRASARHCTPAIGRDGTIYLHYGAVSGDITNNVLYAVRAPASGREAQVAWSVDLGGGGGPGGLSPTIGPDGTIYQVAPLGKLFAVSPDSTVRWTAQTGPSVKMAPAIGPDGTIYTTSLDGKLYAVAPPAAGSQEGTVRWTFDFGEHLGPTPLVTAPVTGPGNRGQDGIGSAASVTVGPDGTLYVGANNSNFYAIAPDGKMKWLFEAERELAGIWTTAALSPDGSTLYFGANKGGLYALNAADGQLRWQYKIFGSIYSSPLLDKQGAIYSGSTVGRLVAIESASGRAIFDQDAGGSVWTAPALRADGSLVVADRAGRVMVFGPTR
jgi:outer membrane protein assembly factor BamB